MQADIAVQMSANRWIQVTEPTRPFAGCFAVHLLGSPTHMPRPQWRSYWMAKRAVVWVLSASLTSTRYLPTGQPLVGFVSLLLTT